MADRRSDWHAQPNITIRPPADLREWLVAYVKRTGKARNAVLVDALSRYRAEVEKTEQQSTTTTTESGT